MVKNILVLQFFTVHWGAFSKPDAASFFAPFK